ncbi:MAG: metallophosphoesterase family protein [Candidatus Brockarchaeota archaeon]|nr:metallophosphoesterase family protein [Candidatus Brockarchaeota archaeon]
MRLFACSDIHLRLNLLEDALKDSRNADLAVCLGDITVFNRGLEAALENVKRLNEHVMIIPGNNEPPKLLEEKAMEKGLIFMHGRKVFFKGFTFAGIGGSLYTPFKTPFEIGEDGFKQILSEFKGSKNLILLSHSPPFNTTLDSTFSGEHVGSLELRKFIEEEAPIICLCGHVHERAGLSEKIGNTLVVNPGARGMLLEV